MVRISLYQVIPIDHNDDNFNLLVGPPGIFEIAPFSSGTFGMVDAMSAVTGTRATEDNPDGIITVACGGDTLAAVEARGGSKFTHLSTGGGAALELLEGLALPGVEALTPLESESFRMFAYGETSQKK